MATKLYAYETTVMVRIPRTTRGLLQQLIKDRGLEESLGSLITTLTNKLHNENKGINNGNTVQNIQIKQLH